MNDVKSPRPMVSRRAKWVLFGGAWVVAIIGVLVALDPIATHYTQKALNNNPDYDGRFSDVQITVIPPGYAIEQLTLWPKGKSPQGSRQNVSPTVYVRRAGVTLSWKKLLVAKLVAAVQIDALKLVVQPTKAKNQQKKAIAIADALADTVPILVDKIDIKDSEVLYKESLSKSGPRLWLHNIDGTVTNLATRQAGPNEDRDSDVTVRLHGKVEQSGSLNLRIRANLFEAIPRFSLVGRLSGLQLDDLHDWTVLGQKELQVEGGVMDVYAKMEGVKGYLNGGIRPVIRGLHVAQQGDGLLAAVEAKIVNAGAYLLESKDGDIKTVIPIKGRYDKAQAQVLPTVLGILRNAWVKTLAGGFWRLPLDTASDDTGFIDQVVRALDENQNAPLAEPS